MNTKLNEKLILCVISIISFSLFYQSFSYYFFQDDWFVLKWVTFGNPKDLFDFRTDIVYWRPLSMPIFFFVSKTLFGLNPIGFHTLSFAFFVLLLLAIFNLFKKLTTNIKTSLSATYLYSTWSIHFISLSWLSTTAYILGPLFQVLSFISFIKFIETKKVLFYLFTITTFILSLTSSELTLVLPLIIFMWSLLLKKRLIVFPLLPFLTIDAMYLALRVFVFPIPAKGTYEPQISFRIVENFAWYVAWIFNFPEKFKTLIYLGQLERSIAVLKSFWLVATFPLLLWLLFLIMSIKNAAKAQKELIFGFSWLIIGLLPIISLTKHSYPMYLSFAGLGFLLMATSIIKKNIIITVIFLALWTLSSLTNLSFTRKTHWIPNEQAISKAYVEFTKSKVTKPEDYSLFIVKPANIEFSRKNNIVLVETEQNDKQALNGADAFQVIFANPTLFSAYLNHNGQYKIPSTVKVYEISPNTNLK